MMKSTGIAWCVMFTAALAAPAALATSQETIKAAVVTAGHGYDKEAFDAMFASFADVASVMLPQADDSEIFEDISAWPYDVIVLYNMTQGISEARKQNLLTLLDRGVGLVALHHAVAAFNEWPEFADIIGCRYFLRDKEIDGVRYPKSGYKHDVEIPVRVADSHHPITQGVEDFIVVDETYNGAVFDPEAQVLLSTGHPKSDAVLGLAKQYRNARVCYLQPGHGPHVFADPNYRRLVAQAIRWAAGGNQDGGAAEIALTDFSAFRGPVGEWTINGNVTLDPADSKKLAGVPGTGAALNGDKGNTRHLVTQAEYGDVEVELEFMVSKGSNSGVYFQGRYEIQILDSWGVKTPQHSDCGGIYQRWREEPGIADADRGFEGRPPRVNASRAPGEWQRYEVQFRAPRFDADGNKIANAVFVRVAHNGVVIHENQEVTGPTRAAMFADEQPTGPIMLQGDHGPVAFRNLRVRPLTAP